MNRLMIDMTDGMQDVPRMELTLLYGNIGMQMAAGKIKMGPTIETKKKKKMKYEIVGMCKYLRGTIYKDLGSLTES